MQMLYLYVYLYSNKSLSFVVLKVKTDVFITLVHSTPGGNTMSAAELTCSMVMATSR